MNRKLLVQVTLLTALALLLSCASPPPPTHSMPAGAIPLGFDPHVDEFNCSAGNCVHWYQVAVPRRGKLRLFVKSFELAKKEKTGFFNFFDRNGEPPGPPGFEITLSDSNGNSISSAKSNGRPEQSVRSSVTKGSYLVSIWSENPGRPFGYRLSSEFKAARKPRPVSLPPPPPPVIQYESRDATILEAEGWGADVKAWLIDLGSSHGMSAGLKGRLMDDGEEIGKIVIEQVFPDGSRAGVEVNLLRPLGRDTRVEILVPIP